ncbi:transketolase [Candidatus Pacearchaeota archaeon CG_4_9_14_3_um_filter_31_7]|nr:MAG: transketolase [Candidatus Pacearchaeota archaeon CG_4_9_14_3_um_filter_31_7]
MLAINTLRFLAVDAIQKANSGHPGMPMGCAPIAYTLYKNFMNHNPKNPKWLNRDRFILSAGHGSMLLYGILHLCGYDITMDDLKNFRQWKSITPGHPEFGLTPGVETTTGPLGQGFANAVGMAIAEEHIAENFNKNDIKILDHFIYGICSDGDLMEGISHEAASIAGHLKLSNLIFLYDNNNISIDGSTSLTFSEDVEKRFDSYGWQTLKVSDVNDLDKLNSAITKAQKETDKPSLIICNTHIGFGSPNKQDTSGVHGSPLGEEEIKLTKKNLNWTEDKSFYVPEEVKNIFKDVLKKGKGKEEEWNKNFETYKNKYPKDAKLFLDLMKGNYDDKWKKHLPFFSYGNKPIATRTSSGITLNAIAETLPALLGGSADLHPSTNTYLKVYGSMASDNYKARNIHYGIREHAMASILNGMAIYGGVIPFGATFLIFSDYMRPAIRLASLSKIRPIYVFTHDSIGLGEDGPTHQPIEHLAALRAIPNVIVIRPADANESVFAWQAAIEHKGSPVALILTRQNLPVLNRDKYAGADNLLKGAYILKESENNLKIILMASGSEIELILSAAEKLEADEIGTRVVSFPSWELFEAQSEKYKESVLPKNIKARISVEAGVKQGWEKYVGESGASISIEGFGSSAPYNTIFENYGFTADNIYKTAKELI